MKTTIKFQVILSNGKKCSIRKMYDDCPDFVELTKSFNVLNKQTDDNLSKVTFVQDETSDHEKHQYIITVEEQIDDWISELDKSSFMRYNDINTIFTWSIVSWSGNIDSSNSKKSLVLVNTSKERLTNNQMVELFLKTENNGLSQELVNDFIAVYERLKPTLKGIKWDKQIPIVFESMTIAYKSASNALSNLSEFSKSLDNVQLKEHYKKTGNGKFDYDKDSILEEASTKRLEQETRKTII